jgi:hypothetical protein
LSDQYPKKFPYTVKTGERYLGWQKTCAHCSSTVEYPRSHMIFLAGHYLCTLTDRSRNEPLLHDGKCCYEYFWREFCIRRLNGQFR